MSAAALLERLEGVRQTGSGRWIARCPAHEDRGPSLSIRELGDGRTLAHCFGGCATTDVVRAVGLTFADLFPTKPLGHHIPREQSPFPAMDVLQALGHEATVVLLACSDILTGKPITPEITDCVGLARLRIGEAVALAGGAR